MSWLKLSTKAKDEQQELIEEQRRQEQNQAKQKEQEIIEKLEKLSLQASPLLDVWRRLDCDRILVDIQKNLLGGDLSALQLVLSGSTREVKVERTSKGWFFGDEKSDSLAKVLFKSGYDPNSFHSFDVTRNLYKMVTHSSQGSVMEGDTYWKSPEPIITITISNDNIYCDGKILGNLTEISNSQILESLLDEVLSNRYTSKK